MLAGVSVLPTVEPMGAEAREARHIARKTAGATLLSIVVVMLGYALLILVPGYGGIVTATQFAGPGDRLGRRILDQGIEVSVADARVAMILAALFSVLWGTVGYELFDRYWQHAWKAGVGTRIKGRTLGLVFAVGGGSVGLVEKLLTFLALRADDASVRLAGGSVVSGAIVSLAWVKWLLAGMTICLVVAMLVSAATAAVRRGLRPQSNDPPNMLPPPPDPAGTPTGVGICCSGGGIRAAGFVLGALARLEEEPEGPGHPDGGLGILGRARYLASVSGGGYAAAAWRITAGTGELPASPFIRNPLDRGLAERPPAEPGDSSACSLIQHVRDRRQYLANGRGGLPVAGLIAIALTTLHFFLLLLAVVVLAWPVGRIITSWPITGVGRRDDATTEGLALSVGTHQWLPPLVAAVAAGILVLARLFFGRGKWRERIDRAAEGSAAAAVALLLLLIAVPYGIDLFIRVVSSIPNGGLGQFALAGIYGTIVTAVWQLTKARLLAVAKYLGGLLLALGLLVFAFYVMAQAADTDELLSRWWVWLGCFLGLVLFFVFSSPDWWSLHGLYRNRLAGTFAPKLTADGRIVPLDGEHPALAAYHGAEGPQPIICCAAARGKNQQTGIPVLSMTFEPGWITVSRWSDDRSTAALTPERMLHSDFERRLPRGRRGRYLRTAMGAAAISGAALAPSLGRMSLRSTNALLAAFNARLGVWVPNPNQQWNGSTTPRLVNMFKEILGVYDSKDPNVYATDGGHWENLGLVELIRRRCAIMICIDASGDPPGTYRTLKEAKKLARLECGAEIQLGDDTWDTMALSEDGLVKQNFAKIDVRFDDGQTGVVLYVKAAVAESSPLHIQRYGSGDKKFPNYSTGDQLLASQEFDHLIHLGYASMDDALEAEPQLMMEAMGA